MRPMLTPRYVELKRLQAARAQALMNPPHNLTYRAVAKKLGYNHPQSVVVLIKNYGNRGEEVK